MALPRASGVEGHGQHRQHSRHGPCGGTSDDIAFVDVPRRGRCFVAVYYEAPSRLPGDPEAVLARVGEIL